MPFFINSMNSIFIILILMFLMQIYCKSCKNALVKKNNNVEATKLVLLMNVIILSLNQIDCE